MNPAVSDFPEAPLSRALAARLVHVSLSWYWIWHPLFGPGYQLYSGSLSDLSELTLLGGLIAMWRHHDCGVKGCWRLSVRKPTAAGDHVCRKHAPVGHVGKSHAQILEDHKRAKSVLRSDGTLIGHNTDGGSW